MPTPTSSLATLRPEIAGSMVEFDLAMDREGFIWNRVLPVFEVAKSSGTFGRIPIEQLLQERDTKRAPRSGYSRGNYKFSSDTYTTEEYGAEEPIDEREAANYADFFDVEVISAQRAMDAVLRAAEKRVADAVFNATTFTSQTTNVTNEWDDTANADPATDIETAVRAVYNRTGIWPDTLIINRLVFRNLRNCDSIIERIQSNGAGASTKPTEITLAQLASVFDIPKILVAGSGRNSANEGQSASFGQIWSNEYAMVCKTATTNDITEPCLGRVFHWGADGSSVGGTVETYRDETVRGDVVRVRHQVGEKIIYTELGQLLDNITT